MVMQIRKTADGYLLRFIRGEQIVAGLESFARANDIRAAEISAIGSVVDPELGFYDLSRKVYDWKTFSGSYEIASLSGNISWFQDGPIVHVHGVFAGPDLVAFAGHLKSGETAATCECVIRTFDEAIDRAFDEGTALNLWKLEA